MYHGMSGRSKLPNATLNQIWADEARARNAAAPPEGVVALLAMALVAAIGTALYVSLRALPRAFSLLASVVPNRPLAGLICGIAALVLGYTLFRLRNKQRGLYAILEIAFAFASAAIAMLRFKPQDDMTVWLAFAAAAYLVVRGFDNIDKAKEESAWPWRATAITFTGGAADGDVSSRVVEDGQKQTDASTTRMQEAPPNLP